MVHVSNATRVPFQVLATLYYTSASTDQQTIDIYIIDSFGQMQQLTLSFNNDNSEEETETITP